MQVDVRGRQEALQVSWRYVYRAKDTRGQGKYCRGAKEALGGLERSEGAELNQSILIKRALLGCFTALSGFLEKPLILPAVWY